VSSNEDRIIVETATGTVHSRTATVSTKLLEPVERVEEPKSQT
jgi:hypothetical protein